MSGAEPDCEPVETYVHFAIGLLGFTGLSMVPIACLKDPHLTGTC